MKISISSKLVEFQKRIQKKNLCGETPVRRAYFTAKFPYGKISSRRKFLRRNFLRQNFLRRNFQSRTTSYPHTPAYLFELSWKVSCYPLVIIYTSSQTFSVLSQNCDKYFTVTSYEERIFHSKAATLYVPSQICPILLWH